VPEGPVYDGPSRTVVAFGGGATEPGDDELPQPSFAGPGGQSEIRVEVPVAHEHIPDRDELQDDPPLDDDIPPSEPADTTPSEHDAEDETPPVDDSDPAAEVVDLDGPDLVIAPAHAVAINPVSVVWGSLTFTSFGFAVIALVLGVLALSNAL
jgi:hypothetical protein